jgi:hypothetical protein
MSPSEKRTAEKYQNRHLQARKTIVQVLLEVKIVTE